MSDDTQPSMTVSIKPSSEYNSALLVFKGSPEVIQQQLVGWFGADRVVPTGTPHETFLQAESVAQAGKPAGRTWNKTGTGARKTAQSKTAAAAAERVPSAAEAEQNLKDSLGAETISEEPNADAPHPHQNVLDLIAGVSSKAELGKVLAAHRDAYKASEDVQSAAKARAGEL